MKVDGPVSHPSSPLAATSPVRGSQISSCSVNGRAGPARSRAFADTGAGSNVIASSSKYSRNESRIPFAVAAFANAVSVSASDCNSAGICGCVVTSDVTNSAAPTVIAQRVM